MKNQKSNGKNEKHKYNKYYVEPGLADTHGITLISLVVTIILLIILAGVAINLSIGENGLFNKAKQAKAQYNEITARERLEVVLAEAFVEKEVNTQYDSEDFLNNLLTDDNMSVDKNIVTVNNYNFLIDREKLKIVESLGETTVKVISEVKEYLGKGENNKYKVSSLITIQSNIEMESIKITNPDGSNITLTTDKQELTKDIEMELDQEYKIETKTTDGKTDTRTIVEKSEEKIRSVKDLVAFRDKVNSGLSYEGKTLKLTTDLDLSNICGEKIGSFEPIGNSGSNRFRGIFDGQNYSIQNIFINKAADNNGLFGDIVNAEIKNLKLDEGNINNGTCTGGICGRAGNSKILNCINNVNISGTKGETGGICGYVSGGNSIINQCANLKSVTGTHTTAGIVGFMLGTGEITNSYNIASIRSKETGSQDSTYISAGIAGARNGEIEIENCYNIGDIYGKINAAGIVCHTTTSGKGIIKNCYSAGKITGSQKYGIEHNGGYNSSWVTLQNNYWLTGCGASSGSRAKGNTNATPKTESEIKVLAGTLGEAYTNDEKIKVIDEDTGEEKEVWKYNNGYPILKWQVIERER